jgi:hypothetical protein
MHPLQITFICLLQKFTDLAEGDKGRYQTELAAERAAMIERGEDPDAKPAKNDEIEEGQCVFPLGKPFLCVINKIIRFGSGRVRKIVKLDPDVKTISKDAMLLISKSAVRT